MRTTFISIILFITLLFGCSSYNQTSVDQIEITRAGFKHWSEAPAVQSDVRERGTDLELIVNNWPEGAEPQYIIFRGRKSFPAEISDTTDAGIRITARIIMRSAVLSETSPRVEKSDRLVFTKENDRTRYVEIEEWSRMERISNNQ